MSLTMMMTMKNLVMLRLNETRGERMTVFVWPVQLMPRIYPRNVANSCRV